MTNLKNHNFINQEERTICEILTDDSLQVSSEMEVFIGALEWLSCGMDRFKKLKQLCSVSDSDTSPKQLMECHRIIKTLDKSSWLYAYRDLMPSIMTEQLADVINVPNVVPRTCLAKRRLPNKLVKTEPGEPEPVIEQRDPSLPTLPVPSDQAHSSQSSSATCPVVKKRKSAIHDLFGDIFVTKVEPATATTIHDKVEKEMSKFKQEIIMDLDTDPLAWWKINEANFPLLANFAKKYLCVPATSVASERVFSSAGDIVTAQRSLLSPEHVDMLIFLAKNFEFK